MTYKNTKQLDRLVTIGRNLWNSLTEDEKEAYYLDRGSFGFIEDVMTILRVPVEEFESPEHFEYVHDLIINYKGD